MSTGLLRPRFPDHTRRNRDPTRCRGSSVARDRIKGAMNRNQTRSNFNKPCRHAATSIDDNDGDIHRRHKPGSRVKSAPALAVVAAAAVILLLLLPPPPGCYGNKSDDSRIAASSSGRRRHSRNSHHVSGGGGGGPEANEDVGRHWHQGPEETTTIEDVMHVVKDECPVRSRRPANKCSEVDVQLEGDDVNGTATGCHCTRPDEIRCTGGGLDTVPNFNAGDRIFNVLYMVRQNVSELCEAAFGGLKVSGRVLVCLCVGFAYLAVSLWPSPIALIIYA